MLLGDIIKDYRFKNRLSQRAFAKLAGMSNSSIHLFEQKVDKNGKTIAPSFESFKQIAKAMNISTNTLMEMLDEDQPVDLREISKKYNGLNIIFANRFRSLRAELGLSPKDLTTAFKSDFPDSNVDKNSVELYESGSEFPEAVDLIYWSKFFKISIDYLVGLSNIRKKHIIAIANDFKEAIKNIPEKDKKLALKQIDTIRTMLTEE